MPEIFDIVQNEGINLIKVMRNKGSKDAHGRYSSNKQMQARAKRLADAIDKFIDQAYNQYDFNKLTDFNKLHEVKDHLIELNQLQYLD